MISVPECVAVILHTRLTLFRTPPESDKTNFLLSSFIFAFIGRMTPDIVAILIGIGFIVGLLSVSEKESQPFLMSGAVLIIASAFGQNALLAFGILDRMFSALLVIFVPATIVVAVRNVFGIATS